MAVNEEDCRKRAIALRLRPEQLDGLGRSRLCGSNSRWIGHPAGSSGTLSAAASQPGNNSRTSNRRPRDPRLVMPSSCPSPPPTVCPPNRLYHFYRERRHHSLLLLRWSTMTRRSQDRDIRFLKATIPLRRHHGDERALVLEHGDLGRIPLAPAESLCLAGFRPPTSRSRAFLDTGFERDCLRTSPMAAFPWPMRFRVLSRWSRDRLRTVPVQESIQGSAPNYRRQPCSFPTF